jgi:hypothetical protein
MCAFFCSKHASSVQTCALLAGNITSVRVAILVAALHCGLRNQLQNGNLRLPLQNAFGVRPTVAVGASDALRCVMHK